MQEAGVACTDAAAKLVQAAPVLAASQTNVTIAAQIAEARIGQIVGGIPRGRIFGRIDFEEGVVGGTVDGGHVGADSQICGGVESPLGVT
jgi:hypothetical protein